MAKLNDNLFSLPPPAAGKEYYIKKERDDNVFNTIEPNEVNRGGKPGEGTIPKTGEEFANPMLQNAVSFSATKGYNIDISKVVGQGYKDFWNFKGRYRLVKGGRGSKKSTTTSLWIIYNMMKHPLANTLVCRRYFNTHRDSTFAQLRWACERLKVSSQWKYTTNPLEMTYVPTGQKILFRGFDDAQSITSITVDKGYLCYVWLEEAYQINDESEFNKLDLSIRGDLPNDLFKQITFTFNP